MEKKRKIVFFRNYFQNFYDTLAEKLKDKIDYVLFWITITDRVPKKFLKYIDGTNGLFEIRVEYESNIYRIFCCFDEDRVVVLFNGFQKTSIKTPRREIEKALRIKREYFEYKKKRNQS